MMLLVITCGVSHPGTWTSIQRGIARSAGQLHVFLFPLRRHPLKAVKPLIRDEAMIPNERIGMSTREGGGGEKATKNFFDFFKKFRLKKKKKFSKYETRGGNYMTNKKKKKKKEK